MQCVSLARNVFTQKAALCKTALWLHMQKYAVHKTLAVTFHPQSILGEIEAELLSSEFSSENSHLDDGVETGDGWLLSETPLPGEL